MLWWQMFLRFVSVQVSSRGCAMATIGMTADFVSRTTFVRLSVVHCQRLDYMWV